MANKINIIIKLKGASDSAKAELEKVNEIHKEIWASVALAYAADSIKLLSCRKPYYEIDLDGYIREYAPNMSESGIESLKTRLLDSGFNYDESSNMWTISRANIEGRDEEDNSMHLGLQ